MFLIVRLYRSAGREHGGTATRSVRSGRRNERDSRELRLTLVAERGSGFEVLRMLARRGQEPHDRQLRTVDVLSLEAALTATADGG